MVYSSEEGLEKQTWAACRTLDDRAFAPGATIQHATLGDDGAYSNQSNWSTNIPSGLNAILKQGSSVDNTHILRVGRKSYFVSFQNGTTSFGGPPDVTEIFSRQVNGESRKVDFVAI